MLSKALCSIVRRAIYENRLIFHTLQNLSKHNSQQYSLCGNIFFQRNINSAIHKRYKSRKHASEQGDEDEDEKESIQVDDYLQTKNSKIIDTNVASLRLDAIAKAGFGISRTKIDKAFYNSNIRVNGEKCFKKGVTVEVEDEIDLITGRSPSNPNFLIVHRCIILAATATSDSISVRLLRNKSLLIEDYNDPWNGVIN